ncbi:MAG: hypothetical protein ABI832_19065 [bacterium]
MLQVLTFRFMNLPQPTLFAIFFATVLLGSFLAAMFLPKPAHGQNRATYFQNLAMALFVLSITQLSWLLYVPALKVGVSGLILLATVLGYLAYGAYCYHLGAARSRDAYGHDRFAFLGLVPILNLVLLFKPGQNPAPGPGSKAPIIIGLVLFILSRVANSAAGSEADLRSRAIADDPLAVAAIQAVQLQSDGIEAGLDRLIQSEASPSRIGPTLTLAAVFRSGLHVTYDFTLDEAGAQSLDDTYHKQVISGFCHGLLRYLSLGATASLHYVRPDGFDIETVDLSLATCTT